MKYEVCVVVWVSLGVRPTHCDTDINKSEALWFSRPGKVSWLSLGTIQQWSEMWQWWKQCPPHCHMLQVSNKVSCLPTQTLLPHSQHFKPICSASSSVDIEIQCFNLPSPAHVFCPITWTTTKISRNPLNQRTGLLTCSEDFWCWDCDKMNVENFSRKVVVCWYPTRRYWLGLDISDYTQWYPE